MLLSFEIKLERIPIMMMILFYGARRYFFNFHSTQQQRVTVVTPTAHILHTHAHSKQTHVYTDVVVLFVSAATHRTHRSYFFSIPFILSPKDSSHFR